MKTLRILYHMAQADFLERVRRYSFLVTLGSAVLFAWGTYTGRVVLTLGSYRGVYNSAWTGDMMALVTTTLLSLTGFYVVKNAVLRDEQTRVGQVLAATPMSKQLYCIGKAISNFAVLASMVVILALSAVVMQLLQGESRVEVWALLSPFVMVALPAMAFVASVAVLFEVFPVLRGGAGNIIYFFAWSFGLALSVETHGNDFAGLNVVARGMGDALRKIDPTYTDGFSLMIGGGHPATKTFLWTGMHWTMGLILDRLLWVAIATGVACFAATFFHRFDPAQWKQAKPKKREEQTLPAADDFAVQPQAGIGHLTPLGTRSVRFRLPDLVASELRLMLKGLSWWWYLVAAGIWIASLVNSAQEARGSVLLLAWVWPMLIWSQMGSRESIFDTSDLVFSAPHAWQRQLLASWLAGVLLAALTGSGVAVRLIAAGDTHGLQAWLAGALFIPSLALAMGVWSHSRKMFEAFYIVWWYTGPAHHMPGLDFMGTSAGSSDPTVYLLASAALLVTAFMGRRLHVAYA